MEENRTVENNESDMKEGVIKKGDFVEIKFTGYHDGRVFDSNIPEDLKKLDDKAEPRKTIIIVGQKMIVPGLDSALEGKEIGKEYKIDVKAIDGFGMRDRNLIKTIPLSVFREKNQEPKLGGIFVFDDAIAKVITISGARVVTDFNIPLAGKDISYKFEIVRKIENEKEKCKSLLEFLLGFSPEFELREKDVIVKGRKELEDYIKLSSKKFKEILGKELTFEMKEEKEKDSENRQEEKHEHKH